MEADYDSRLAGCRSGVNVGRPSQAAGIGQRHDGRLEWPPDQKAIRMTPDWYETDYQRTVDPAESTDFLPGTNVEIVRVSSRRENQPTFCSTSTGP